MEELAERIAEILEAKAGESLVGVSYHTREEVGHVYRSEWGEEKYTEEQVDQIVDELRLESIGYPVHEKRQEESLNATVRIYDEMLDIAIPVNDVEAILFALKRGGDYTLLDLIENVEAEIEASNLESQTDGTAE